MSDSVDSLGAANLAGTSPVKAGSSGWGTSRRVIQAGHGNDLPWKAKGLVLAISLG